jgi:hypothetical protein
MAILGLALGFIGCTQKEEPTEDDQESLVEDNTKNLKKERPRKRMNDI